MLPVPAQRDCCWGLPERQRGWGWGSSLLQLAEPSKGAISPPPPLELARVAAGDKSDLGRLAELERLRFLLAATGAALPSSDGEKLRALWAPASSWVLHGGCGGGGALRAIMLHPRYASGLSSCVKHSLPFACRAIRSSECWLRGLVL